MPMRIREPASLGPRRLLVGLPLVGAARLLPEAGLLAGTHGLAYGRLSWPCTRSRLSREDLSRLALRAGGSNRSGAEAKGGPPRWRRQSRKWALSSAEAAGCPAGRSAR